MSTNWYVNKSMYVYNTITNFLLGIEVSIDEVVKSPTASKYLQCIGKGLYKLKEKHSYYGQVQIGMALFNLKIADFVVFASLHSSLIRMEVPLNMEFVKKLLFQLKFNYFINMLHNVCINDKQ